MVMLAFLAQLFSPASVLLMVVTFPAKTLAKKRGAINNRY